MRLVRFESADEEEEGLFAIAVVEVDLGEGFFVPTVLDVLFRFADSGRFVEADTGRLEVGMSVPLNA